MLIKVRQDQTEDDDEGQLRRELLVVTASAMAFVRGSPRANFGYWLDEANDLFRYWVHEKGEFSIDSEGTELVPLLLYWQDEANRLGTDFPLRKRNAS